MGVRLKSKAVEDAVKEKNGKGPDLRKFNEMANEALYKRAKMPDELKKMNRMGDNANQAAKILNPKVGG